jgi:hypothetical protein
MRRRSFLAGAATLGAVLPSLAQTGGAMRRIGVLGNNPPSHPTVVRESAANAAAARVESTTAAPASNPPCGTRLGAGSMAARARARVRPRDWSGRARRVGGTGTTRHTRKQLAVKPASR